MPRTTRERRFNLEPHQYDKIVAPLRSEKASSPTHSMFAVLWLSLVLLLWPMGERMIYAVGEAIYTCVTILRDALGPS